MELKDAVLAELRRSGTFVSGEEISRTLGVTRASVSNAVRALRVEGYEITAVTRRGYRIDSAPDVLTPGEVAGRLPAERAERVLVLPVTDSTNTRLIDLAGKGAPDGQVVIADAQTGGLGRRGRSFASPEGVSVYLSYLLRPEPGVSAAAYTQITAWVCVAVCSAIEAVCGIRPGIKWVNDLLLGGRKICGILTQMNIDGESGDILSIVTGIGINVNNRPEDFPEELRGIAASLFGETGKTVCRAELAAALIRELDRMRAAFPQGKEAYLERYRRDCAVLGRRIRILSPEKEETATAVAVGDDFSLCVQLEDGTVRALSSGEISIRPA